MTGIIVLAAGESSRFGTPKQLADFKGKPLLRHAVETAINAQLGPVNVVLGAVDQPCRDLLEGMEVSIIHNPDWRQGMGGSIAAGLRPWMGKSHQLNGVIILLADQPQVQAGDLQALEAVSASKAIVASSYNGQLGVPAWFAPDKFAQLLMLEGEKGAKAMIAREPRIHWIDAPSAAFDVDTPADLAGI